MSLRSFFSPEQTYNLDLLPGTKVELVGLERNFLLNGRCAAVKRFFSSTSAYELELHEPFEVPPADTVGTGFLGMIRRFADSLVNDNDVQNDEMRLTPGARIRLLTPVPMRFVQLASDTSDNQVAQIMEASQVQSTARLMQWASLPQGQRIQVSGPAWPANQMSRAQGTHVSDPSTCSSGRLAGGSSMQTARMGCTIHDQLATITSPHKIAGCFKVQLDSDSDVLWRVMAAHVHPLVSSMSKLKHLELLSCIHQEARQSNLDLPVGQVVELVDTEEEGQVARITGPYDQHRKCYPVLLLDGTTEGRRSTIGQAKLLMAAQYGVSDLLNMTEGQLIDLWDQFGLSRRHLRTPDTFLEQAMEFLPPEKPVPVMVPACSVQPLISDQWEADQLRERHEVALALALTANGAMVPAQVWLGDKRDGPEPECKLCGELIRGHIVHRGGETYHFGCSL
mmetsp:Transcript_44138/g.82076  ORF Transcript_44138/g.82076 Transcript_44138/m.82076 type:complete len:451 (-) Transcript_44138:179-1531(-)